MDGFKKAHRSLEVAEHSVPASQHHEEKEAPVVSPRRLRDRELLKRKKEESREKDTYLEQTQTRSKRPRQTRGTGSRRRKQVEEPEPQLEPQPEPDPDHKHEQATEPWHETEPNIDPDHKDEQAAEPQHEPEPNDEPDHKQAAQSEYEFEPENKIEIGHDVQQVLSQHKQEHLAHREDPVVRVSEDGSEEETYAINEESTGHFQHDITSLIIADKEGVADVEPEPLSDSPEVLRFPEQEEHQYYTPLL
ncbi:hemogen [Mantella aurantiaca]